MVKVKILKNTGEYKKNDVVTIPNNDAHTLIDKGVATLDLKSYKNKEMRSE